MGLNELSSGERIHIGFFGARNAGKSSLVNAVTAQQLSVVSDKKGTTTDPVRKAMEILPLGPVVIIDTPGIDDEGELGALRVQGAKRILGETDIAILVVDGSIGITASCNELIEEFKERDIPYIVVYNKSDLVSDAVSHADNELWVSAVTGAGIEELRSRIAAFAAKYTKEKYIVADLLNEGELVVLVIPIDESAPKGRLILPQQLVMRELLDKHCGFIACQETELSAFLDKLCVRPKLVITDSQVFGKVAQIVPEDLALTSFSVLFARYKGELRELVKGADRLSALQDGDKVLISEGCTHHRQCNDIGAVKLPRLIRSYSGKELEFSFSSGRDYPEDLSGYALNVHCGGCMLNEAEMHHRIHIAKAQGVPIVNYGIAIAQMTGILYRSLKPFPESDYSG